MIRNSAFQSGSESFMEFTIEEISPTPRRKISSRKRQIESFKRQKGLAYVNRKGRSIPAKEFVDKPCYCSKNCNDLISAQTREKAMRSFYMMDKLQQNEFIRGSVKSSSVKRRRPKTHEKKPRENTFSFFIQQNNEYVRVCKKYFSETFQVPPQRIYRCCVAVDRDSSFLKEKDQIKRKVDENDTEEDNEDSYSNYGFTENEAISKHCENENSSSNSIGSTNFLKAATKKSVSRKSQRKSKLRNKTPKKRLKTDMAENLDLCYETVLKLVEECGEIIASRNAGEKKVMEKTGDIDLLTETDQQVERKLIDGLLEKFPNHKFIGEEEAGEGKKTLLSDDPTWIIDPVDGTMNFVHSFPHSCVSIALLVNKIPEIGIVYNPILKQKFTARRGQGAFHNGQPIHVSGQKSLSKALVTTEFGTSREEERMQVILENMGKVIRAVHGIRITGAAALNMCMVALGGADVNYEFGPHAWDMAAGDLIVREAGGVTMDPAGGPLDIMSRRVLAASSKELADDFCKLLTQFYPQPRDD